VLISRSARAAFMLAKDKDTAPTEGRTQAQIIADPEYAALGSGDLLSRTSFGDCRLHAEWFCPPGGEGQLAANSGLYIQDRYELQILGTPAGNGPLASNEAGSVYQVRAPDVNASTG